MKPTPRRPPSFFSSRVGADDDVKKLALGLLAKLLEADHQATESEAAFYQKAQSVFEV